MSEISEAPYDTNNIFARILRNEIPSYRIFENEHVIAILDAYPVAPGHSLLIPKAPVRSLCDMTPEIAAAVFQYLPQLANAVKAATGSTGVNLVANCGEDAGQVVFHAHFHVIPRFPNDGKINFPKNSPLTDGQIMVEQIKQHL